MDIDIYDAIGLIGVCLSIYCYARVQWQRDYAKRLNYSLLNFLGSIFFMIAILHKWNIASFVSNAVWLLISLYGIYRCSKYMSRSKLIETRLHKIKRP
jgi:hypothetical protein